jgi:gamma-glutamylcysteine synthetase
MVSFSVANWLPIEIVWLPIRCQLRSAFLESNRAILDEKLAVSQLNQGFYGVALNLLEFAWTAYYLYGVQGVECSNHSVPTKNSNENGQLRNHWLFLFLACAKPAQTIRRFR